ncbi:MAG: response regulator transcription factor [bacterium]
MADVLLIDDDEELCELLGDYLGSEGFVVEAVHDGEAGLARLDGGHGLVILDVMLPGMSGFDVLRRLRERSAVPVLMLTARGDDVDRIVGLEMGADDYLPKPFNPRELVARLRAIRRRAEAAGSVGAAPGAVRVGDVELDPASRQARLGDEALSLTSVEFALLDVLLRAAGRALTREDLADQVLGRPWSPYDRSIDVHVSNLRRKLGDAGGRELIKTVRGVGYQFADRRERP